ncbi:MAG: FeoB-associated Cys-rich membrane protein [bacterium]|nr:FeoB-associated Cys-rich membrane protein [bacterium]
MSWQALVTIILVAAAAIYVVRAYLRRPAAPGAGGAPVCPGCSECGPRGPQCGLGAVAGENRNAEHRKP